MSIRMATAEAGFESEFAAFLTSKRESSTDVAATVQGIIAAVRDRGDAALLELTRQFDRMAVADGPSLRFSPEEISDAKNAVDPQLYQALEFARNRIFDYHHRQRPSNGSYVDDLGVKLGHRWTAIGAVGLYVPGGLANYPSSVLMNAVPAKVAGVKRLAMVVPTPDGVINPAVLAAASIAGVDEMYRLGGAQAIAALAYGTQSIAAVDKIVGPGNAYVATAKRLVFGTVGIDMIAGPSEVLIIADKNNNPAWIAADLLAQAEHDTAAQSILITDDSAFADAVCQAVEQQLETLPRAGIAAESWRTFGAVILVGSLQEAPALANRIAAEHLEIALDNPENFADQIDNAGAIFLGRLTPEVIGDYVAGSNHVLPTARSARFSSGLGVLDFMKRTSILQMDSAALKALGPAAMTLAEAEGLDAHLASVKIRLDSLNGTADNKTSNQSGTDGP